MSVQQSAGGRTATPDSIYWILLAGVLSFSVSPILVRLAGDAPSLSLVVLRTAFSIVILAPFAILRAGNEMLKLSRKEWIGILGAGTLLGIHFYVFFEAIRYTTIASATVFVSLSPIFLGILGFVFLRERLSKYVIIAICLSVTGGIMIGVGDAGQSSGALNPVLGNLLAVSACLMASLYLIMGRIARQQISWLAYVFPLYFVASAFMIILALITKTPFWDLDPEIYLLCIGMAVFPQIMGHGSFNYAIKFFPAAILGLLSLTEPIGSTFLAYLIFDELPSVLSLLGMSMTLIAVSVMLLPGLLKKKR